jgi:hypothetical protein
LGSTAKKNKSGKKSIIKGEYDYSNEDPNRPFLSPSRLRELGLPEIRELGTPKLMDEDALKSLKKYLDLEERLKISSNGLEDIKKRVDFNSLSPSQQSEFNPKTTL